jgi:hypothetical protein
MKSPKVVIAFALLCLVGAAVYGSDSCTPGLCNSLGKCYAFYQDGEWKCPLDTGCLGTGQDYCALCYCSSSDPPPGDGSFTCACSTDY